jgi:hypothetical protein
MGFIFIPYLTLLTCLPYINVIKALIAPILVLIVPILALVAEFFSDISVLKSLVKQVVELFDSSKVSYTKDGQSGVEGDSNKGTGQSTTQGTGQSTTQGTGQSTTQGTGQSTTGGTSDNQPGTVDGIIEVASDEDLFDSLNLDDNSLDTPSASSNRNNRPLEYKKIRQRKQD